jgi:predicted urease superfamily metal-dependent hydrolase
MDKDMSQSDNKKDVSASFLEAGGKRLDLIQLAKWQFILRKAKRLA